MARIAQSHRSSVAPVVGHRYWRLNMTAGNGATYADVSMLRLKTVAGGAQAATGGVATAKNYQNGFEAINAFTPNNAATPDNTNFWSSYPSNFPQWLQYAMASRSILAVVEYDVEFDVIYNEPKGAAPKNWTLQYSDNGSTWTTADTRINQTSWTNGDTRTFTVTY